MIKKKNVRILMLLFFGIVLLYSAYILFLNFKSLKIQLIVAREIETNNLNSTSESIINFYPWVPNLTVKAEPIAVQKARYLINEKKYNRARKILKKDNSNPFDGRKEFFIAVSFYNEKKYDSAIYYSKKCFAIKPKFYHNTTIMASCYEKKGNIKESLKIWESFLKHTKEKLEPWRVVALLNSKLGNTKKAKIYIDSALVYHTKNKELLNLRKTIKYQTLIAGEDKIIYDKANKEFLAKNYEKALILYTDFINKTPNYTPAYRYRAYCNYYRSNYLKSIIDIKKYQQLSNLEELPVKIINLLGVNYYQLGNKIEACKYFNKAKAMGDRDGISNAKRFCN